ncbi:hypothetical protein PTH_0479 [Pelotomaculum thermopropionicum SI]|uniref:Uncharacterized protein n=1 Tax=Pelotomaculum thermopropionicum (strain DSM 13744 / JCM 10971 / SI) TaxID=370438 RepID=A5D519_PELTS|nr:hypothetical protein PTH_0479 [Pelotomaculum thermopropionicum SI]
MMLREAVKPLPPRRSQYGIAPELVRKRAADLPDMVSVLVRDLFPDASPVIFPGERGLEAVREAARLQLEKVDLSMIKPGDSVNVLGSHHGFTLLGGAPYAEMLKVIKDVVQERTGCRDIRLRVGVGLRFRESEEYIKSFGLDKYYAGKAAGVAPVDEGVAIETEIGTLYGIKKIYDARWIIHAHNSDVREVHFHRQVDRAVKPFGMSYARIETRSTYHQNLGPRAANFVARAIFDSPFVQEKFACAVFLTMSPTGVVGVDADNDLYALNDRVTYLGCRDYGKMMTLLGEIDEAITILDFPSPVPYVFAAGVIYANFVCANRDLFDLDYPLPPYTWYTEAFYGEDGKPLLKDIPPVNPAIKMVVHNYAWGGYPSAFFTEQIPTIMVGREQAELFNQDPQNLNYNKHTLLAEDLDGAVAFARKVTGVDKIIAFDGASGALNVSRPLGEYLLAKAPGVARRVNEELLPKWLKQRGIDPARFIK